MTSDRYSIIDKKWRNYFLIVVAIGVNLATLVTFIIPTAGKRPVADFKFPQAIKLSSEKVFISTDSDRSPLLTPTQPETIEARQKYQYKSEKSLFSLQISYITNTRGDVMSYLQKHTNISSQALKTKRVSQIEGIGAYVLLHDRHRAYLSSCISPRSLSNVSPKQFSQYRYQNDLTLKVAGEWLLGKASIRDRRCLWINLSMPLVSDSHTAYKLLESSWREIYHWGRSNFPPL